MQESTLIDVAINQLIPSKRNVRKSRPSKEADQELLAGIRAEGLLQNLVVIQNGSPGVFEVVAGKRRLKALQQLVKEGHYQDNDTISCRFLADPTSAEEVSLIENTQRVRMHPADEFEACRKMQRNGMSVDDIAASLGIPESTVKKRLKLGQLAPAIIKAYRNDEISQEAAMAFTIEDDKARQAEAFEALKAEGWAHSPHKIRDALRAGTETNSGKLARFVGEKAYTKAGGTLSHDLFQEVQYFLDRDILVDLAIAKLERAAKKIQDDWNWTEITIDAPDHLSMLRIEPHEGQETAKLVERAEEAWKLANQLTDLQDEFEYYEDWEEKHGAQHERLEANAEKLDAEADASRVFKPEEMALAGCIVTICNNGRLELIEGLVRKSDEKALKALQAPASGSGTNNTNGTGSAAHAGGGQPEPESDKLSQALQSDLITYRTNIAKRFIAIGGEIEAQNLLYYTLCMQTFRTHYWGSPLDIKISETRPSSSLAKPDTGRALQELQAHLDNELKLDWMAIEDDGERFQAFTELEHSDKTNLMAYCVAQALVCGPAGAPLPETEVALQSLDIPWHKYFQATADNYLGRISKGMLLEIGEQFFTDYAAEGAEKRSRKQLAEDLEAVLAGEDSSMPADKRAEAIDWIPAGFKPQ